MFFFNGPCRWNSVKSQCSLVRSPISQIVFKWTMPFTSHPWANPDRYKSARILLVKTATCLLNSGDPPRNPSDLALWRHDPQASLFAAVPGLFDWGKKDVLPRNLGISATKHYINSSSRLGKNGCEILQQHQWTSWISWIFTISWVSSPFFCKAIRWNVVKQFGMPLPALPARSRL